MKLEVSALTRRDRLERIAAAERDRRAGRTGLATATLGEAAEWPARLVLALIGLPEEEGAETRSILMSTLDDWAAETGLDSLDADAMQAEATPDTAPADLEIDAFDSRWETASPIAPRISEDESDAADALDAPIEIDELERAFAEAEAQTDEMHDVNTVAERVLMDEPLGLAELSGEGILDIADIPDLTDNTDLTDLAEIDDGLGEIDAHYDPAASSSTSASAAIPSFPSPYSADLGFAEGIDIGVAEMDAASVPNDDSLSTETAGPESTNTKSSRGVVLATLGRWLTNLENNRAGRAQ